MPLSQLERVRSVLLMTVVMVLTVLVLQLLATDDTSLWYWQYTEPASTQILLHEVSAVDHSNERAWRAMDEQNRTFTYTYDSPILWVGGMPRSGTTLMRVILDAHDDIRCAPESRVIPRLLTMRGAWTEPVEAMKLNAAGLSDNEIDRATADFIMSILVHHGQPTRILCNKDPYTLENATYLTRLFPNSRFILMIRDARAVTRSIMKQKMKIIGCMSNSYASCLASWQRTTTKMIHECETLGPTRCLRVFYESMVLDFRNWVRKIMQFLQLQYDEEKILQFHELVGIPGGISVSEKERSTNQVNKPMNQEGLFDWLEEFPPELYHNASIYAPLLSQFGYDMVNNPPNYTLITAR